jgi:tRNA-dihydrouridine synthase 1
MELTGCDGVMSSESILEYPALFDPTRIYDMDKLCHEYIEMFEKYPGEADLGCVRAHLFKFLHMGLTEFTSLRSELGQSKGIDNLKAIAKKMQELRSD